MEALVHALSERAWLVWLYHGRMIDCSGSGSVQYFSEDDSMASWLVTFGLSTRFKPSARQLAWPCVIEPRLRIRVLIDMNPLKYSVQSNQDSRMITRSIEVLVHALLQRAWTCEVEPRLRRIYPISPQNHESLSGEECHRRIR